MKRATNGDKIILYYCTVLTNFMFCQILLISGGGVGVYVCVVVSVVSTLLARLARLLDLSSRTIDSSLTFDLAIYYCFVQLCQYYTICADVVKNI